ncbi:hypothetical protein LUD75_15870 [Epilithonimonas sp. JDS]|uniref:DUF5074 domain-containing protein n=1 Tax=Epilithonimonas sp. JDS TaxID=2902797 RepID=UPI001E39B923|nr:DUF5074 domain-containing protein [Epilithonimonas sp. JDS]MCD9856204.1 hypothetical protein [Epilithonimonas sp. JDS]
MKFNRFLTAVFASALLVVASCNDDDEIYNNQETSYSGILVVNEGSFTKPDASVDFLSSDLSEGKSDIYTKANNENLGDVLQTIGFKGTNAYLVVNNSNKIVIANRFNFSKNTTVTSNLVGPRYIAFTESQYYVTNYDFANVKKLNIYNNADNTFIKSINFDRYAEKVVEAGGNIVVQTDGTLYNFATNSMDITGHTITIVKPSTNAIDKTVILPDSGAISDLISYEGYAYALSSGNTDSYIYKINAADGTFTVTTLTGIPNVQKLRIESGNFYFLDGANKVYSKNMSSATSAVTTLFTTPAYSYSFNVIDGKIFVSNSSFSGESTSYVYSLSGNQIKSFKSGIGTNGFYKN